MTRADQVWLKLSLFSSKVFWVFFFLFWLIFGGGMFELRRAFTPLQLTAMLAACFLLTVLFYFLFISGFICLGRQLKLRWLTWSCALFIASNLLVSGYLATRLWPVLQGATDAAPPDFGALGNDHLALWLMLGPSILFGTALLSLAGQFGGAAGWAGCLEILAGAGGFVSLGLPLYIPAAILKAKILRRAFSELPP